MAESTRIVLAAGSRLGPYEIVAPLGAGGMGEVYRARDTRLDRTVAIKVLPEELASDPQFIERLDREARAVSALEHPHICALYDVGMQDGTSFLVMQYLEGETLAERLNKGSLPIDQGLKYAIQIADALDRAHRSGVIHRDLKPGNVMLTKTGAKLLDFGLAKTSPAPIGSELSMVPTTPPDLTAQGAILGTVPYMAPEQLEGQRTDVRTDIFAFGAVLHELLTGRKAFAAKSQAGVISAILSSNPPAVSSLQPLAPPALDHLVSRCLAKDADDRWQSAHDLKLQLTWIADAAQTSIGAPQTTGRRSRERVMWGAAVLALVGVIALMIALLLRRSPDQAAEATQFTIDPPRDARFTVDVRGQAISPDGRQIVFAAARADGVPLLWLRALDSLTVRPLPATEGASAPFWSPDSRSIGFFARGKLRRIDVDGSSPEALADAASALGVGGTWSQDGVIVFSPNTASPLFRVSADGGTPTPVTALNTQERELLHGSPSFLPDGRHFLFAVASARPGLYVGSIDGEAARQVLAIDTAAVYAPPGYLLFLRGSTLTAQRFDPVRLSTSGTPIRVADNVSRFISVGGFSVSNVGTLVFRPAATFRTELVWIDRANKRLSIAAPAGNYGDVALSPDGRQVAFDRAESGPPDVWLLDLQRGVSSRFTLNPDVDNVPIWSPDGQTIAFAALREGGLDIYQRRASAGSPEEPLLKLGASPLMYPTDWSSDGRYLTYYRTDPTTQNDIWVLPLFGDRKAYPLVRGPSNEEQSQFSPNGNWIAYMSEESGSPQVYVQPFPSMDGKWQISTNDGTQPRWRRDGKELFYLALDGKLMSVAIKGVDPFDAGAPQPLFQTTLDVSAPRQEYEPSVDGTRFLLNAPIETASAPLTVVLNWPALLRK